MLGISIAGKKIGSRRDVYVVAEMSANHGQNFHDAVRLVHAAKQAGADAIKLQTYTPDTLTIDCQNEYFRIGKGTVWEGRNLYQLYREAYTPWDWQPKLKQVAESLGLDLFSTPFDASAVDFLEEMDVPAYKVASFEIVDIPLLRKIGETRKPVILSTGMATFDEIQEAVETLRQAGTEALVLLKCTSAYPASPEEMNLRTLPALRRAFGAPVGLSDHTVGNTAALAAVALGACIVEKHLTLSRAVSGPDSAFSLEPDEFHEMVSGIRETERALGKVRFGPSGPEMSSRVFRRSLFVVEDMEAGDVFTEHNVRSIRPGNGLHPRYWDQVLGCRAGCAIPRGTPLDWSFVVAENRGRLDTELGKFHA